MAHLTYSAVVSVASLAYVVREPQSLQLMQQPADLTVPTIITTASAGECWLAGHTAGWLGVGWGIVTTALFSPKQCGRPGNVSVGRVCGDGGGGGRSCGEEVQ